MKKSGGDRQKKTRNVRLQNKNCYKFIQNFRKNEPTMHIFKDIDVMNLDLHIKKI
jgi:hypothetical protein